MVLMSILVTYWKRSFITLNEVDHEYKLLITVYLTSEFILHAKVINISQVLTLYIACPMVRVALTY